MLHRWAHPYDLIELDRACSFLKCAVFLFKTVHMRRPLENDLEDLQLYRLLNKVIRAALDCGQGIRAIGIAGRHDNFRSGRELQNFL